MDLSQITTVTEIRKSDDGFCYYYGNGNANLSMSLEHNYKFKDSIGKFQIGDTITINKTNEKFKTKTQK